jgi:hypothetical protein
MKRFVLFLGAALFAACDNVVTEYEYYTNYIVEPRGIALSNAADLAKIGVDEGYPLNGAYYLTDDIDLSEMEEDWTPIGTAEDPFSGILNGYGKTIRGFTLPGGETRYTGLFGYLYLARLANLTIEVENTQVNLSATVANTDSTYSGAGVAAGYVKASNIDGVTINGAADGQLDITNDGSGYFGFGGFAGVLEESTVSNIKVNLNLKASYPVAASSWVNAGLVAGRSVGGSLASCFAEGNIEGSTKMMLLSVGGIVGEASTQLENCVSAVTKVSGESDNANIIYVGGITGSNSASLVSCGLEAEHPVTIQAQYTGSANAQVYAGGISGMATGSINKGVVDADVEIIAETASAATSLYAGGIAGQGGNISGSFVRRGEVLAKQTADTGTSQYILAGGISGNISVANSSISNSFSNANVTVDSAQPIGALRNYATAAGGIAGHMAVNTHIIESGASGTVKTVSASTNNLAVFAGGIAGAARITGISIERSAALNGSVAVEVTSATPHAYRVLGGVITTTNPASVVALDDIPDTTTLTLDGNCARADMTVQTKQGSDEPVDVSQPNNAVNLTGNGDLDLTQQAAFEETLGWDFETDWAWDDEAKLPVPRYN